MYLPTTVWPYILGTYIFYSTKKEYTVLEYTSLRRINISKLTKLCYAGIYLKNGCVKAFSVIMK